VSGHKKKVKTKRTRRTNRASRAVIGEGGGDLRDE